MSKILILGATGNIGGLTASRMASEPGVELRLASSKEAGCATLRENYPNAEIVQADWYDQPSLVRAMTGVGRVLFVTPDFYTDERVATPNVIAAAKSVGSIQQIVRLIAIPPGLTEADLEQEFLDTRCGANLHVIAKPLLDASGLPMTYVNIPAWIMFNLPWFLAAEVKARRRFAMPAVSDAARMWVSEGDIADVVATILKQDASEHVGREYVLTAAERHTYRDIAKILSKELGEEVVYADYDAPLKEVMGDAYDTLMTYFRHETQAYSAVVHHPTVAEITGRPQETVAQYIHANRELFV